MRLTLLAISLGVAIGFNSIALSNGNYQCDAIDENCWQVGNSAENLASIDHYDNYAYNESFGQRFDTQGERAFVFNPRKKAWAAYDDEGYLVASGIANGGGDYCQELHRECHTPVGIHRVESIGESDCVSRKFPLGVGGAAMPYCMFFGGNGAAIHGSAYLSDQNSSHGCIRVHTHAAEWLKNNFMSVGTKVIVLSY